MPHKRGGYRGVARGVTLVELLLFSVIASAVILWLASWMSKPAKIQEKMLTTWEEQKMLKATDVFVNDIRQMIPGSLQQDPLDPGILSFKKEGAGATVSVQYRYQVSSATVSTGEFYRTVDSSGAVVLNDVLAPGAGQPLFRQDMPLRILTLQVRRKGIHGKEVEVVRRVAVPR